jgi:hypothetical protein
MFTFSRVGDVKDSDFEIIRRGLAIGDAYFEQDLGMTIAKLVAVQIGDLRCAVRRQSRASAGAQTICMDNGDPGWPSDQIEMSKIAVHERFHNFQAQNGCTVELDRSLTDDVWLQEGAAEYVGFHALVWSGRVAQAMETRRMNQGRSRAATVNLRDLERDSLTLDYSIAAAAAGFLLAERPATAYADFCRARGGKTEWRAAFEQAFGRSIDQFYAEFAAWVGAAASPTTAPLPTVSAGAPLWALATDAAVGTTRIDFTNIAPVRGEQITIVINPGGTTEETGRAVGMSFPGGGQAGYLLLALPLTYSHTAGETFALKQ